MRKSNTALATICTGAFPAVVYSHAVLAVYGLVRSPRRRSASNTPRVTAFVGSYILEHESFDKLRCSPRTSVFSHWQTAYRCCQSPPRPYPALSDLHALADARRHSCGRPLCLLDLQHRPHHHSYRVSARGLTDLALDGRGRCEHRWRLHRQSCRMQLLCRSPPRHRSGRWWRGRLKCCSA